MSDVLSGAASATRALSLTELFALERRDFAPASPATGLDGFRPHFQFTELDPVRDEAVDEAAEAAARHAAALEAARAEAFAAGLEAGRVENIEVVEQIVAECQALIHSLDDARIIDKAALGPMMKNAVLDLVTQIVEAHVAVEPAFVNACIGRALSAMKEAHEAARLYLHPDDIANVGADATEGYRNLTIAADPELPRGSVRLEAGGGEIEDGVRLRIARLEQALRAAGLAA